MTKNRKLRRLATWRKRLRRHSDGHSALPGLYDRALLFGGGVALTLSILAAAAVGIAHRFERCIDGWRTEFLVQRDFVNASVERNQARLRHAVETYEALSHVHERNAIPIDRYHQLLAENAGVVVTGQDVGTAPITILSTLTAHEDRERFAILMRLMREISPNSLMRQHGAPDNIGGFLYTEDRRFFAAWPPPRGNPLVSGAKAGAAERSKAGPAGIEALVDRYVANVDAALNERPDALLRRDRVFWVAFYESDMYGTLVKHYAAPIYRGGERIAVLAVTLPAERIPRLFQPAVHDPDFFMLSRDRRHLIGISESNPRGQRWMRALEASPSVFELADERVRFVRRGGDFFVIQRIAGPEWIVVSAFNWRTIVANLKGPLSWTVALAAIVMAVQWAFIILIDRLVLAPLRVRARRVFESEAFSRTVFATAPVGLTVFDPSMQRIVMQNGIARALLAGAPDEVGFYRRLVDARSHKRRGVRAGARRGARAASTDAAGSVEVAVSAADGRRCELAVAFARARYRAQEVVLCSLTDISRQKETVRLLRRARQAADAASRAKSVLVATISHEIRTPLYGALGNLELLSMEALAPSQAARVGSVRRAMDALRSLVDDVLDLSKAEACELRLNVEPFCFDEVIERCAQTLAPAITGKGLRFLCLIDPSIAGGWRGDGLRIAQVLTNLLGNACKFTQTGSITVRATVSPVMNGDEAVVLSVADSGIGIAANRHARIFEPFTQADHTIGLRFGGTGLGLSLCRRLVDLMGGCIEVKSVEGRGAVFTVRLPLQRDLPVCAAAPLGVDELAFDAIVVTCETPLWQSALLEQLRRRFGASVRIEAARFQVPTPAEGARAIIVLGSHVDEIPAAWRAACGAYLDVIVVSERGPLHPQRRADAMHVTSLSAMKLELAVSTCAFNAEVPALGAAGTEPSRARIEHRAARILVVDDDPVSRALLADQLEALGYRHVGLAADGREALADCLRHPYDLVVADLCMPVMGGRELFAALRGKGMTMPVIAHTAAPCAANDAGQIGFAALLCKPLSLDRLREALDVVFDMSTSAAAQAPAAALAPTQSTMTVLLPPGSPGTPAAEPTVSTGSIPPGAESLKPRAAMLRAVFAASWPQDDARLCVAASVCDAEAFLHALHRLKGALLVLGERDASVRCDALCDQVRAQGMEAIADAFQAFRRDIARFAKSGDATIRGQ